jgi:hypothetical protein
MGRNYLDVIIEHIDPRWEEGRNYQLICGLRCDSNEIIASHSYNVRKTNRFVPYRVKSYAAPTTFGDVGEFLINSEWVVCEFGGKEWWEESNKIGNSQISAQRNSRETLSAEGGWYETLKTKMKVVGVQTKATTETCAKGGSVTGKLPWWNNGVKRRRCLECPGEGYVRGWKLGG